jgi:hypothetical protein
MFLDLADVVAIGQEVRGRRMLEGVAGDSFGQPSPAHRECRFVPRSETVGVPSVGASGCLGYDQLDAAEPYSHLNDCQPGA